MNLTESDTARVRGDLLAGIAQSNRKRSNRRLLTVPIVGLAIFAASSALQPTSPAYAVSVAGDGLIRVEVYPEFDDVDSLQDSLEDVGLDVVVIQLVAHPSLDGVVEVSSHNNAASGALEFDDGEFVIDVAETVGEIEILIYSAAPEGRPYQAAPSVFAPDQPLAGLHCAYADGPIDTLDFEDRARTAGYESMEWIFFEAIGPGEVGDDSAERPEGVVVGASEKNATTLRVIVLPEVDEPAAELISMADGTHQPDPPTCTPELAAAWE